MAVLDLSGADPNLAKNFGGTYSFSKASRHTDQNLMGFVPFHLTPGWPLNLLMCSGWDGTSGYGNLFGFF